jgi:hypothetical protein
MRFARLMPVALASPCAIGIFGASTTNGEALWHCSDNLCWIILAALRPLARLDRRNRVFAKRFARHL